MKSHFGTHELRQLLGGEPAKHLHRTLKLGFVQTLVSAGYGQAKQRPLARRQAHRAGEGANNCAMQFSRRKMAANADQPIG